MLDKFYEDFEVALEEQKVASFIALKKDIMSIKSIVEKALSMGLESTAFKVERDFNVTSL